MTVAAIDLEINPKIEAYRAEMMKMPGITQDAANKSSEALRKSLYVKAAKDAAGLGRANAKVVQDVGKSWADLGKKIAELAGGPFSMLGSAVFDLVPKAGAASSAMGGLAVAGGAVAATAVGIGAVGVAAFKLADAASEARKRLDEAGESARISDEARESLRDYDESSKRLRASVDELTVSLGGGLAGALADAKNHVADTIEQWQTVGDTMLWVASIITADPAAKVAADNRAAVRELADEQRQYGEDHAAQLRSLGLIEDDALVDAQHKAQIIRDQAEAEREATRATRERVAAARELAEVERKRARDYLAAMEANEDLNQRERERRKQDEAEATRDSLRELADEAKKVESAEKTAQAKEEAAKAEQEAYAESYRSTVDQAFDAARSQLDILGMITAGNREGAMAAFAVSKAAAISQIAISTAVAAVKALEIPIFGEVLSASIIAQGAAQGAIVAAQKPQFALGGTVQRDDFVLRSASGAAPDHGLVHVGEGERVQSRSEVSRGGGEQPIVVQVRYGHRHYNDVTRDNLRQRNSPLARAVRGSKIPGRRSR
jgi:hypothetical protein